MPFVNEFIGVPQDHQSFWAKFSGYWHEFCRTEVYNYFLKFIGSLSPEELLHFIKGSSIVLADSTDVTFNLMLQVCCLVSQLHTPAVLLLSFLPYIYPNFEHIFHCILESEYSWLMDSV